MDQKGREGSGQKQKDVDGDWRKDDKRMTDLLDGDEHDRDNDGNTNAWEHAKSTRSNKLIRILGDWRPKKYDGRKTMKMTEKKEKKSQHMRRRWMEMITNSNALWRVKNITLTKQDWQRTSQDKTRQDKTRQRPWGPSGRCWWRAGQGQGDPQHTAQDTCTPASSATRPHTKQKRDEK